MSRYSDSPLNKDGYRGSVNRDPRADFMPRGKKSRIFVRLMILIFALSIGVTAMVLTLNKMALIGGLCLMIFFAGWYVIAEVVKNQDLVLATEFQNALFASALGYSNKFSLIIKNDGSVVYTDKGFQQLFPELVKERMVSLEGMMRHGKVAQEDREKIFSAITRCVYDRLIFDMYTNDKKTIKVVLSVEPIVRPSGFILLRGREFVEKRTRDVASDDASAQASGNPMLNKTSVTLFAQVISRLNTGMYMTDASGVVIYANRLIEQWLGYGPAEMVAATLTLKDLVHQAVAGQGTMTPGNFEGEMLLRRKEGGVIKVFINQKVIAGDDQKPLGCVAMICNTNEIDPEKKKALW